MNKSSRQEVQIFSAQYPTPKIVFLYGYPGCGKKHQASRLNTEYGYVHLDLKNLMTQEIRRGGNDGQILQKTLEAGLVPPAHIRVNLLIRAFSLIPAPSYVITGFLKNLTEALEFEKQICSIKIIANFIVTDWEEFYKRPASVGKQDRIESYRNSQQDVLEFYRALSVVRDVDSLGVVDKVFRKLRQSIQPEVFFLVGPPGCGKNTLGKKMADRYNLEFIDAESILLEKTSNGGMKKITNDDAITKKMILAMQQQSHMRYLIRGYPMNEYQLKQFESSFGPPTKMLYLALYKEELILRCKRPTITQEYGNFSYSAGKMLDYAEKKNYFSKIDVNLNIDQSLDQISKVIEPEAVMIMNDTQDKVKNFLVNKGYQYLNLNEAMKSICSRLTEKGKEIIRLTESGKIVSGRMLIKVMQDFLYSGSTFGKKFVIGGNYPNKVKELEFFERHCVKIQRLYYFVENEGDVISNFVEEHDLLTYMFDRGQLVRLESCENYMDAWADELKNRIDRAYGRYILFLGPTLSGKSIQAKRFSDKTNFKIINYEEIPETVKTKKSTEDEPYEKVTFDDLLEEIMFNMQSPESTIILDGIPPESQVLDEIEAQGDDEEAKDRTMEYMNEVYEKFISKLGIPYLVFHLSSDAKILQQRLFKKLELGPEDELNEDQIEPLTKNIKFDSQLASKFSKLSKSYPLTSIKSAKKKIFYEVNTNISESKTFDYIKSIFIPKLAIVEETLQKDILTIVNNICINHDLVHINIPKILIIESKKHTERGELIASLLKQKVSIPTSLITSIIKDHLIKLFIYDQIVILTQFIDNKDPYQYPRSMDEFISIEETLGEIVGVIIVTPRIKKRQIDVDQIPVVHYPPPKKKEEEEQARQEENEEGEEVVQKPEEDPLPPRSEPRKPVNLPKMFQLYKRNMPKFVNKDDDYPLEKALKKVFKYVAMGKYLSLNDQERFRCPNIQIIN